MGNSASKRKKKDYKKKKDDGNKKRLPGKQVNCAQNFIFLSNMQ